MYAGSSPRVRGTQLEILLFPFRQRFIPARAGNTEPGAVGSTSGAVHPRACGEHCPAQAGSRIAAGSSPRVRGTLSRTTCHNI